MAFRDESEALRARVEVLERELASLRDVEEERDRLKAQVEELESQLGHDQARKKRLAAERANEARVAREARRQRFARWAGSLGLGKVAVGAGVALVVGLGAWQLQRVVCGPSQSAAPTIGMVDIDTTPEPALPPMSTTGISSTPSECRGYVPDAPQLVLRSSQPVALRIAPHATSGDLVMMVAGPDGRVLCDDDGGGSLNPLISAVMAPGDTRVWVGTYSMGESIDFTLGITARPVSATPDGTGLASAAAPTAGVLEGPDASETFNGWMQPVTPGSSIDASCRGFLPLEPQLTLRLSREAAVRLHASGQADLVMLVREADGSVRCDDDSGHGNEPQLALRLGAGEHRVWIGTYSETASAVPFALDARAHALDGGARVEVQRVTGADLTIEGETRDEIGAASIGARCGNGLIGAAPQTALELDGTRDVVLALATESVPYAIVEHPDRSFECVTTARSRHLWGPGVHRVYVGVAEESTPGPFTLTVRAEPTSVQPWAP